MRRVLLVGLCTVVLTCAACSAPSALSAGGATNPDPPPTAVSSTHVPPGARPLAPPAVPGLTWHAEGTEVGGRPATYVATTDHGSVALMWMDPSLLTFRFVPGSKWPEQGPILRADRSPSTWLPHLAAAFNGAFKLNAGAGGYFYAGQVVRPLRDGLAALVVSDLGRLSVVRWGRELGTTAGESVVRENLPLLIDQFTARTSSHDTNSTWGWADNDRRLANRSALGELSDGSLVFAYGYTLTAADMAAALVQVHTRTAIMLDMNLSQPQGFVYWRNGGHLQGQRILPSIYNPPSVYFEQTQKDFVVALARA